MTEVVLYDYWRSSASYRVRIALAYKGVDYRSETVDLLAREQREAAHRARNPQGYVPVLEIDGCMLSQSLAIIEYLDARYPQPPLWPEEAMARAQVNQLAQLIAMDIAPVNMLSVLEHVESLVPKQDAKQDSLRVAWMQHFMGQGLHAFEALLAHHGSERYCFGEQVTVADICLIPQVYNAERWGVSLEACPRIVAIAEHCRRLAAFMAAAPE